MLPSLTGHWPWSAPCLEGKTLLSSGEASMKSCTATAGFLASSGAEEMLLHLDRATSSLADACFAPSPDPLPIAEPWLLLPVWTSACHDGHQTTVSCVTPACIIGWLTSLGKSPQHAFWSRGLSCFTVVVSRHVGSWWLCTLRRD